MARGLEARWHCARLLEAGGWQVRGAVGGGVAEERTRELSELRRPERRRLGGKAGQQRPDKGRGEAGGALGGVRQADGVRRCTARGTEVDQQREELRARGEQSLEGERA